MAGTVTPVPHVGVQQLRNRERYRLLHRGPQPGEVQVGAAAGQRLLQVGIADTPAGNLLPEPVPVHCHGSPDDTSAVFGRGVEVLAHEAQVRVRGHHRVEGPEGRETPAHRVHRRVGPTLALPCGDNRVLGDLLVHATLTCACDDLMSAAAPGGRAGP